MDFPPGFFNNRNDNQELKAQIRGQMQNKKIDDQLRRLVENSFNETLATEAIILSRSERETLFQDILRDILTDLLTDFDNS